jgi:hypothetical protein
MMGLRACVGVWLLHRDPLVSYLTNFQAEMVLQYPNNFFDFVPFPIQRAHLMGGERQLTGCEFSAAPELLVLAKVEGNSSIREWCGQNNAKDSGAQPDTKRRGSQGFFSGMEQLCLTASRS